MLSVKVEDYGETDDEMHYVTYRASGLSEKELDFLLNIISNLSGSIVSTDFPSTILWMFTAHLPGSSIVGSIKKRSLNEVVDLLCVVTGKIYSLVYDNKLISKP